MIKRSYSRRKKIYLSIALLLTAAFMLGAAGCGTAENTEVPQDTEQTTALVTESVTEKKQDGVYGKPGRRVPAVF